MRPPCALPREQRWPILTSARSPNHSLLLALVFTLFLALPFRLTPPSLFQFPLWPTFAVVCLTHALLSYAWVARVRKIGIPSISYASLIVLVALTFAALGSWGVLV